MITVYTDIYIYILFNLHASVYILTFTCIFYLIYMQVYLYVWSMQNIAEGLRRPERLWFFLENPPGSWWSNKRHMQYYWSSSIIAIYIPKNHHVIDKCQPILNAMFYLFCSGFVDFLQAVSGVWWIWYGKLLKQKK